MEPMEVLYHQPHRQRNLVPLLPLHIDLHTHPHLELIELLAHRPFQRQPQVLPHTREHTPVLEKQLQMTKKKKNLKAIQGHTPAVFRKLMTTIVRKSQKRIREPTRVVSRN